MSDQEFQDITKSYIRMPSVDTDLKNKNQEINNLHQEINGLAQTINEMKKQFKKYAQEIEQKKVIIKTVTEGEIKLALKIVDCEEEKEKLKIQHDLIENKYQQLLECMTREKSDQMEMSQQLGNGLVECEDQIKALVNELTKSEQKVFTLSSELTQKNQKIIELQRQTSKLHSEMKQLRLANTQLSLKLTERDHTSKTQAQTLQLTIKKLQNFLEQNTLQAQLTQKTNTSSETKQLLAKVMNYEDEKRELQDKVNSQQELISNKQKLYDQLEELYGQALEEQHKYQSKIQEVSKNWAQIMTLNNGLTRKNIQLEGIIMSLKYTNSQMNDKIVTINTQLTQLKEKLKITQNQLQKAKRDTRSFQQCQYELETLRQKLQHQQRYLQDQKMAIKIQYEQHYRQHIERLTKQRETFSLQQIRKILKSYIVRLLKEIGELKLDKKVQTATIRDEMSRVKQMCNQLFLGYQKMGIEEWKQQLGNKKSASFVNRKKQK